MELEELSGNTSSSAPSYHGSLLVFCLLSAIIVAGEEAKADGQARGSQSGSASIGVPIPVGSSTQLTQYQQQNQNQNQQQGQQQGQQGQSTNTNQRRPRQAISYAAERVIGNGSFGVVYQATVLESQETVAIKKVLQDRRFKNRELMIMSSLNHPNIVALKHCFYSKGERVCSYLRVIYFLFMSTSLTHLTYRLISHHLFNISYTFLLL